MLWFAIVSKATGVKGIAAARGGGPVCGPAIAVTACPRAEAAAAARAFALRVGALVRMQKARVITIWICFASASVESSASKCAIISSGLEKCVRCENNDAINS
eukprot:2936773-Pyramimonas_sp.AAC.1